MKYFVLILFVLTSPLLAYADSNVTPGQWASETTGGNLAYQLLKPPTAQNPSLPLVIYLENLPVERIGQESNESIIGSLLKAGDLVMVLDYAKNPAAKVPTLDSDTLKLRSDLFAKKLLADQAIDLSHVFILAEGCQLKRDVSFCVDGKRNLGMDVIYPSHPKRAVGTIIEFSCDNKDRMGMYSLVFCTDTTIDTAGAAGFAVAMADHPVAAPYKGFDPLPECGYKLKAAIRTLRSLQEEMGVNGKIGVVGFSRGSGMALLLAAINDREEFENEGAWIGSGSAPGVDSSVQAAVVMSGRFDYLHLIPADKMIPRYNKMWGSITNHEEVWRKQSAITYVTTNLPPLFLTINVSEGADARHHMEVLRQRLDELHLSYQYEPETEPRGHKMPVDKVILENIRKYLDQRLN